MKEKDSVLAEELTKAEDKEKIIQIQAQELDLQKHKLSKNEILFNTLIQEKNNVIKMSQLIFIHNTRILPLLASNH